MRKREFWHSIQIGRDKKIGNLLRHNNLRINIIEMDVEDYIGNGR